MSYKAWNLLRMFKNVAGFGRRTLRSSLALLSVVGAIGESRHQERGGIAQTWATWPEGASAPNGPMMCRGHGVPEMVTPARRTTSVSLVFFKLDKYVMLSFAMTSGLASDSDKFKIIITLRRVQKNWRLGTQYKFRFFYNQLPLMTKVFLQFQPKSSVLLKGRRSLMGLISFI